MPIEKDELSVNAMGGTEQMKYGLAEMLGEEFLQDFQIIPSRVRDLDEDKIRILWCHDLPEDGENRHLTNGGWAKFHKIVFVSNWQAQRYIERYGIPWSKTVVLLNAIKTINMEGVEKPTDKINFIYHTTPHRGLNLLIPTFSKLAEEHPDIHLDVYSSFSIYGWKERDAQFQQLFDAVEAHPQMTYHGFKPHDEIVEALKQSHIFAYPDTWQETSCISLIEAMNSKNICIHPNYGALYETAANWTVMYDWQETQLDHLNRFYGVVKSVLEAFKANREVLTGKVNGQKAYTDMVYSWEYRKEQWKSLLESLRDQPRGIKELIGEQNFNVNTPG